MKRQSDKKVTKQVRIDNGLHMLVKVDTARQGETIRERLERYIYEGLNRDGVKYDWQAPLYDTYH